MANLSYAEWQRLKNFHVELGLIGVGFTVLVTILGVVLYKLGGRVNIDKLISNPYVRFVYACMLKPHDKQRDAGQQGALESFYSAQVGSSIFSLSSAHSDSGKRL